MLLAVLGSISSAQDLRLLARELVIREDALLVQFAEPLELVERVRAGCRLGRRGRGRRAGVRSHAGLLLLRAALAGEIGAASHGGGPEKRAASTHQWHAEPPYSAPSGRASPSATMISGAAATTRGPP